MRAGGSKEKGSSFERLVCKRMSLWLSKGERDDLFWRSAMSGGRATVQLRDDIVNLAQSGDLTAIGPASYAFVEALFIECKHLKDLGFGRGFICQTGIIWNIWQKACRDAERLGKRPVLIARQNLYPIVAIVRDTHETFGCPPLIMLPQWDAELCLFETATAYRKIIRRRPSKATTLSV